MFTIHFENDQFVVIDKQPNVSVHKDEGETMLVAEVARSLGLSQLFLVHRLDKMTSGLLILAKSSEVAREFAELFAERKMDKYYLALADKKPKKKQGTIKGDMERSRRSAWKLTPTMKNPAITQFVSQATQPGVRLFLCRPLSGKTHQIRVALKSVGSAIIGDPIYHSTSQSDRGYLHAFALRFRLGDKEYQFVSDPRAKSEMGQAWNQMETSSAIEQWSKPWELSWPKK
ncbi:TIGR01621 family pseudouridine synthase [Vibrio hippocampi]|uniref:Pseudouridine synthase RsuA/RluA-like domain-containing protein n=1 Tax=Vibrio hippocampi TaxID=654686 RepID=A0ABM8ZI37_9VIBR|nr:TIGR01621 family pseudouridine synthase [Vibrio hippocampi]CAH0526148.1 hypothetical protein VHP8226_01622 [Vibrio hippocampi]